MQASLPTKRTQTLTMWGLGGVPQRTKRELGASANLSIRSTRPGHEYAWKTCPQTFIPTSGPLPDHSGRPYTQGLSSLQNLDTNFPFPSCNGMPPKMDIHINITTEVQQLLSHAILDTSRQASGDSTPKRPTSPAWGFHTPPEWKTSTSW